MQMLRDAIEDMLRETVARGDTKAPGWRDEIIAIVGTLISEEREACAQLVEGKSGIGEVLYGPKGRQRIADKIRMRSNVK